MIPTQCNPFNYGGCLARAGHCPFCLGRESFPADERYRQFPDAGEWRVHIYQHFHELSPEKVQICPHPRPQCAVAFESEQELRFHLQDVHCPDLMKDFKRLRGAHDDEDIKASTAKRIKVFKTEPDAEFQFVDEGLKLWHQEAPVKSKTSSTGSKSSTPAPSSTTNEGQSDLSTPLSSVHGPIFEKIDPSLLHLEPAVLTDITVNDAIDVDNLIDK